MSGYSHFTLEDREKLIALRNQGFTQERIAKQLRYSQSAISRELARNSNSSTLIYDPESAQRRALARKRRGCKIDANPQLKEHIIEKLELGWSPDIISARLKMENEADIISHETIYQWIYQPVQRKMKLYKSLARHKSRRGPRKSYEPRSPKLEDKKSIHLRPDIINNRARFGDWEGDLMIGKYHKSQILTLQERRSKFLIIQKLASKNSVGVCGAIYDVATKLKEKGKVPFVSITLDNGTEFNEFNTLEEKLGIDVYFCDPYASWQKGGIENANGIVRRTIPKRTSFDEYNENDINNLMWNINTTPRKCLGYKTPFEVIAKKELTLSNLGKWSN